MTDFRGFDYPDDPYPASPAVRSAATSVAWGVLAGVVTYAALSNELAAVIAGLAVILITYHSSNSLEPELTVD